MYAMKRNLFISVAYVFPCWHIEYAISILNICMYKAVYICVLCIFFLYYLRVEFKICLCYCVHVSSLKVREPYLYSRKSKTYIQIIILQSIDLSKSSLTILPQLLNCLRFIQSSNLLFFLLLYGAYRI